MFNTRNKREEPRSKNFTKHQNVAVMKELIKKKSCKRIGYGHILFCTSMTKKLTKGMRWGVKAKKDSCAIQKFEDRRGRLVTL